MKDMNTEKLVINWQNFARVRLQLKFAFILQRWWYNDSVLSVAKLRFF